MGDSLHVSEFRNAEAGFSQKAHQVLNITYKTSKWNIKNSYPHYTIKKIRFISKFWGDIIYIQQIE